MVPNRQRAVESELLAALSSEFFCKSKKCQVFLEHLVKTALLGHTDRLKERSLGVELFGRTPTYNTGEDAIVRVAANGVRRRLTQHNLQFRPEQVVRIELQAGSYVPEFHWIADALPPPPPPRKWGRIALGAAGILVLLVAVGLAYRSRKDPVQTFWQPVLDSSQPAIVCIGHPVVYILSARVHEQYKANHDVSTDRGPYALSFKPDEVLGSDIIPVLDQFVGVGDAQAAFRIQSGLLRMNKPFQMRTGNEVSSTDLRNGPLVLVGAFSNRWTMQMARDLRFAFAVVNGKKTIVDHIEPSRSWSHPVMPPDGKVSWDYALISRVFQSESGQVLIMAGGITQYGTQAAGDFLSDPRLLRQALTGAPRNWERLNMQAVLGAKVVGATPGPPEVLATHFWPSRE
jgi:hypothetical protein